MNRVLRLSIAVTLSSATLLIALLLGWDDTRLHAQQVGTPTPTPTSEPEPEFDIQVHAAEGKVSSPGSSNLDSDLNRIVERMRIEQMRTTTRLAARTAAESAPLNDGRQSVAVTLHITEGYADAVVSYLEANGASPRNSGVDYIEAYIPVRLLATASTLEGVVSIQAIVPPQAASGTIVSQGVAAHGVPSWHAAGYKGSGVKIGIIDAGFKDFTGSDLPSTVSARCYTAVGEFTSSLSDCDPANRSMGARQHGTAVTEAVFDIAPEATYYIANPQSYGDVLSTTNWMVAQGVDVINMSLAWTFAGPGDGTSPYSNAPVKSVDAAVTGGAIWVNSAGNYARDSWYGPFTDSDSDNNHEFNSSGNECNGITVILRPMLGITAQLRWDDSWGGADKDLDLFLIPETSSDLSLSDSVASSTGSQTGATDDVPYEKISLGHGEIANGEYCLAVRKSSGSAPSWVQLLVWGNSRDLQDFVSSHSIANPAESSNAGMLAVGAAHYSSSSIFTSRIERFSSHGPTMDDRTKPDITGADGGDSKIWGNWYGTSQSSPHVAGLAALVKQRFPSYTPSQIASYLKTNALARRAKPNNIWGHGFAKLPAIGTPTPVTPVPLHVRCADLSSSNRNLSGCDLANAELDGRTWALVDFSRANLTGQDLSGSGLTKTNFTNANLTDADLSGSSFIRTTFRGANLTNADLSGSSFIRTDFTNANLRGVDIGGSSINAIWSNTVCPDGSNSDAADNDSCYPDHLTMVTAPTPTATPGTATPTPTPTTTPVPTPQPARCLGLSDDLDLSGCDLSRARIIGTNLLSGANLTGTDLTTAFLYGNNLSSATLTNADLIAARLYRNDLSSATLTNADLTGAELHRNDLSGANLTGADFTAAHFHGNTWSDTTCPDGTNSDDAFYNSCYPDHLASATPTPVPLSADATLSALTLSGIDFGVFASDTESYTASVAYSVSETTVTPTLRDADASYIIKLGGVTDTDGAVSLEVGSNIITVEVTAEDDSTTKTYTVSVTRADPPAPSVTGVEVTSSPAPGDTYLLGETIRVTLTFSEKVDVTGTPQLKIDMDPAHWGEKTASYHDGSGTASLTFTHTVVEPNLSTQGIAVLADSLTLNGGSIRSSSSDTDAELSHIRLEHDADHKVDWQRTRPNRAPVVDTQAENYKSFTGDNNAPRGVLVSKPFYQVFTDPDGDELTYSVSITTGNSRLVDEIEITLDKDFQPESRGWPPIGAYDRVFFLAEAESDWKAITPPLPHRPVVTVRLTATDPDGLSASVEGDFLIHWETYPEVVSAVGSSRAIELTFDMDVLGDPAPLPEQFTVNAVNADGSAGTVEVSGVSVSGSVVTLALATELVWGQAVTLDYAYAYHTPLRAADGWGDPAPWFKGQAVELNLPEPPTPTVIGLDVSSSPASGDTYRLGETIRVTLTFSEKVEVTGTPRLKIDMDPADWGEKWASYEGGSGTTSLTFAHTVVEPNYSTQGIAVLVNSLELNGGTIRSSSSQVDADLSHTGRNHDPEHKVDWQ